MAFPILQVGAVLTNIICTKLPIPTRPNCYREKFGQFPHKFKCCPFNHVFVNHGRICACVSPQYGYHRYKYYEGEGYGQKKTYYHGYNLPRGSKRKTRIPVKPMESISNKMKVTAIKRPYKMMANHRSNINSKNRVHRKAILTGNRIKPIKGAITRGNAIQRRKKAISRSRKNGPIKSIMNSNSKRRRIIQKSLLSSSVGNVEKNNKERTAVIPTLKQKSKGVYSNISKIHHLEQNQKATPMKSVKKHPISTKSKMQADFKTLQPAESVTKSKLRNSNIIRDSPQKAISDSRSSQSPPGNIPIYYLNYNFQNGNIVRMPVIYEYQAVLPPEEDRFIPLPNNKGFLVPISIFVFSSGRFVYNPTILRRHPSLLSHIRLARQRGVLLQPVPLKQDTTHIQQLSSFLNTRSHRFDDIIFDNSVQNDQLKGVIPLEMHDQAPQSLFLGNDRRSTVSKSQNLMNGNFNTPDMLQDQNQRLAQIRSVPSNNGILNNIQNLKSTPLVSSNIRSLDRRISNLQLQNLKVISNRDFIDKSNNIRKTFHPDWIPDLDLFRMLTSNQNVFGKRPPNTMLKSQFQKTLHKNRIDLHNTISSIPLDSNFDLKTNNLGRPLPDIPGPLSIGRTSNSKSPFLHFTGLHKGPVAFPFSRVSNGIKKMLPGSLQSDNNPNMLTRSLQPQTRKDLQTSENSVAIPSGRSAVFNLTRPVTGSSIDKHLKGRISELPSVIIPNYPPLPEQNKVTLNFRGVSVRKSIPKRNIAVKLDQIPPNPLEQRGSLRSTIGLQNSIGLIGSSTTVLMENSDGRTGSTTRGLQKSDVLANSKVTKSQENSVKDFGRARKKLEMPIQNNKMHIPFNKEILKNQGSFKYRTFFNLPPRFFKTGSSADNTGVIGIVEGKTKVYPIPIFPGAISGKIGEPIYSQTNIGMDIFNGQEFSPFLDPTTNLPVGFTVTKFDNQVGGIVDLVKVDKPKTDNGNQQVGVVAKENTNRRNRTIGLLNDDLIIDEIMTVLRRRKESLGPNENELVIPPRIIGPGSRANIFRYLKVLKSKHPNRESNYEKAPPDLKKLLKNPVFVRYIKKKTKRTTINTRNIPETRNISLIFDRVSVSRKPVTTEVIARPPHPNPTTVTKSNTKILNSRSREAMVFLTAKQIPPQTQKITAKVIPKNEPVISLPVVPVLELDSIDLRHQKPLKMNLTKELCSGCTIDGGLGYANHPSRCGRFVVCFPGKGGSLVPIEQECPYGLFWSQNALTCRLPKDATCAYDICHGRKDHYQYSNEDNCQSFWECLEGYSVPRCCPTGAAFMEGNGCVKNNGFCRNRCPGGAGEIQPVIWQGNIMTPTRGNSKCDKRSVPGSPTKFERHVYFQSNPGVAGRIQKEWMVQECSPGTEFLQEVCDCRASEESTAHGKRVCSPDVYLPFTHDLKDISSARTHVRADNVTITNGTACFNGRSALAMPRFANMDLGSFLYMKLRYRHTLSNPKNEVLLYNGDCEKRPSLILGSTADGNFASVLSTTGEQHTVHVKSPISATDWRTVSLIIDNGHIQLISDSQTAEKSALGAVERAQCGMKIGWGEGYEHFNGCIDDFTLYRCKPERSTIS